MDRVAIEESPGRVREREREARKRVREGTGRKNGKFRAPLRDSVVGVSCKRERLQKTSPTTHRGTTALMLARGSDDVRVTDCTIVRASEANTVALLADCGRESGGARRFQRDSMQMPRGEEANYFPRGIVGDIRRRGEANWGCATRKRFRVCACSGCKHAGDIGY